MNRSIVQLQVSQAMRGRIVSIDMMSHGLMPLGLLPISWIAERHGVQSGLVVGLDYCNVHFVFACFLLRVSVSPWFNSCPERRLNRIE